MKRASVTACEKRKSEYGSYLVDVDDGLPEVVLLLVEARRRKLAQGHSKIHSYIHSYIREHRGIVVSWDHGIDLLSHTNLTEETGVVLVDVGSVVVLTTGHTTTTWVLSVLADTTLTGGDVAAVLASLGEPRRHFLCAHNGPSASRLTLGHPDTPRAIHPLIQRRFGQNDIHQKAQEQDSAARTI